MKCQRERRCTSSMHESRAESAGSAARCIPKVDAPLRIGVDGGCCATIRCCVPRHCRAFQVLLSRECMSIYMSAVFVVPTAVIPTMQQAHEICQSHGHSSSRLTSRLTLCVPSLVFSLSLDTSPAAAAALQTVRAEALTDSQTTTMHTQLHSPQAVQTAPPIYENTRA